MKQVTVIGQFELTYTQSNGVTTPSPETFEKRMERVIQKDLDGNSDAKASIKVKVYKTELVDIATDELLNELFRRCK